ncbi:MAG: hypothetical protein ACC628_07525, partial [Pirellulaceae bacterium]
MRWHFWDVEGFEGTRRRRHRQHRAARRAARVARARRLLMEPLEDRRLLSVTGTADDRELLSWTSAVDPDQPVEVPQKLVTETSAADIRNAFAEFSLSPSQVSVMDVSSDVGISRPDLVAGGDFYRADGRQVPLWRRTDQVVVGLHADADLQLLSTEWALGSEPVTTWDADSWLDVDTPTLSLSPEWAGDLDVTMAKLTDLPGVDWAAPVFVSSESGLNLWPSEEIVVALTDNTNPEVFFATDAFANFRRMDFTTDQFIATVASRGGLGALEVANSLEQDPNVVWASPDFFAQSEPSYTPNDPLYNSQWHLRNTGQTSARTDADVDAPEAWDTTFGSSDIVVAIHDDAVQTTHPDLPMYVNSGEVAG